jgi:hypothetical protein
VFPPKHFLKEIVMKADDVVGIIVALLTAAVPAVAFYLLIRKNADHNKDE